MTTPAPPVDLRELFARPWAGPAELWRPWWLRWLPVPARFAFRSEILNVTDSGWDVRDTTTFPDGRQQVRTMRCERLADGRLRLTADDMPGGAIVTPRADGFAFSPYKIRTPVLGPLRVALRFSDTVTLQPDGTMLDVIEMRYRGAHVGTLTIRLEPVLGR
ncbi:MAG: hypothetical protein QOF76_3721 [Solirubrobacteraceae bacterium]|nr:hypothetical protein [Solirubrobacteraceae bacterium]